ncbi:GNAT family N-acetyltransferase [Alteromonas sp. 5E99-2]|uniref:GNAT family N-acetyltransferase n=1 Tax=Alteromonas sp. 5E99-2 TaxID=2817683 RepID=UPI001A97EBD4|nr:GNAT family N-acetyltransferase [Alteromonas sp. 5E99-2]MBO1255591.1 GNAT family N-acetyltransferase [Alteromonas sp. 5E99-2]
MNKIKWLYKRFNELTNLELYALLRLRSEIFVVEQNCVYADIDNKDTSSEVIHILAYTVNGGELVACARCLPPGVSYNGASIGRVAVHQSCRGEGIARTLMNNAIRTCQEQWSKKDIEIGAQLYLKPFYESVGFKQTTKPYDEDGIMHLDMKLEVLT